MKGAMAAVAALGLFLLGVMVGGAGMHLYYADHLDRPPTRPHPGPPWLGDRLLRQLDLDAEQRERVERILADTRREAETVRRDIRPRFEEILEHSASRLEEILTPEQQERYEQLRRQHRERVDSFLGGAGRGGRRPRRGPRGNH